MSVEGEEVIERSPEGKYVRYAQKVGTGSFKTVWKGQDMDTARLVAWNTINIAHYKAALRKRIMEEVMLLKRLEHPCLLKFYGSWLLQESMQVVFITELFQGGTLKEFTRKYPISMAQVKKYCRSILECLVYLHTRNPPVIHRDLKCDNIFIDSADGNIKIGDLGLSTQLLPNSEKAYTVLGTPEFMAPEMYEAEYTETVDIYAFGMCVLEMITKKAPYEECASNVAAVMKKVTTGQLPEGLATLRDKWPDAYEFVHRCIVAQGDESRPCAAALLKDKFLQIGKNDKERVTAPAPTEEESKGTGGAPGADGASDSAGHSKATSATQADASGSCASSYGQDDTEATLRDPSAGSPGATVAGAVAAGLQATPPHDARPPASTGGSGIPSEDGRRGGSIGGSYGVESSRAPGSGTAIVARQDDGTLVIAAVDRGASGGEDVSVVLTEFKPAHHHSAGAGVRASSADDMGTGADRSPPATSEAAARDDLGPPNGQIVVPKPQGHVASSAQAEFDCGPAQQRRATACVHIPAATAGPTSRPSNAGGTPLPQSRVVPASMHVEGSSTPQARGGASAARAVREPAHRDSAPPPPRAGGASLNVTGTSQVQMQVPTGAPYGAGTPADADPAPPSAHGTGVVAALPPSRPQRPRAGQVPAPSVAGDRPAGAAIWSELQRLTGLEERLDALHAQQAVMMQRQERMEVLLQRICVALTVAPAGRPMAGVSHHLRTKSEPVAERSTPAASAAPSTIGHGVRELVGPRSAYDKPATTPLEGSSGCGGQHRHALRTVGGGAANAAMPLGESVSARAPLTMPPSTAPHDFAHNAIVPRVATGPGSTDDADVDGSDDDLDATPRSAGAATADLEAVGGPREQAVGTARTVREANFLNDLSGLSQAPRLALQDGMANIASERDRAFYDELSKFQQDATRKLQKLERLHQRNMKGLQEECEKKKSEFLQEKQRLLRKKQRVHSKLHKSLLAAQKAESAAARAEASAAETPDGGGGVSAESKMHQKQNIERRVRLLEQTVDSANEEYERFRKELDAKTSDVDEDYRNRGHKMNESFRHNMRRIKDAFNHSVARVYAAHAVGEEGERVTRKAPSPTAPVAEAQQVVEPPRDETASNGSEPASLATVARPAATDTFRDTNVDVPAAVGAAIASPVGSAGSAVNAAASNGDVDGNARPNDDSADGTNNAVRGDRVGLTTPQADAAATTALVATGAVAAPLPVTSTPAQSAQDVDGSVPSAEALGNPLGDAGRGPLEAQAQASSEGWDAGGTAVELPHSAVQAATVAVSPDQGAGVALSEAYSGSEARGQAASLVFDGAAGMGLRDNTVGTVAAEWPSSEQESQSQPHTDVSVPAAMMASVAGIARPPVSAAPAAPLPPPAATPPHGQRAGAVPAAMEPLVTPALPHTVLDASAAAVRSMPSARAGCGAGAMDVDAADTVHDSLRGVAADDTANPHALHAYGNNVTSEGHEATTTTTDGGDSAAEDVDDEVALLTSH